MEGTNVIFSKQVRSGDSSVGFMIEGGDIDLSIVQPHSLSFIESIDNGVPVVVASFTDGAGDLVLVRNLDTATVYEMTVIVGDEDPIAVVPLRIASIEMVSSVEGQAKQIVCEVTFVHAFWYEFCLETHSRGWRNTSYSAIVEEIVGGEVSPTSGVPESVVQPYWSNMRMVDWIAKRCVSTDGKGDYVYGVRLDGEFFFKPYEHLDDLIEDPIVPRLFSIRTKPHRNYKQGESGIHSKWYDYDSGTYQLNHVTYQPQGITDWTLIDEAAPPHLSYSHGRNKEYDVITDNRIKSITNTSQAIDVILEASEGINIRIGQKVDIQFTASNEFEVNSEFSENYAGEYVVVKNKTAISQTKRGKVTAHTELTVVRPGFNDSERRQFLRG